MHVLARASIALIVSSGFALVALAASGCNKNERTAALAAPAPAAPAPAPAPAASDHDAPAPASPAPEQPAAAGAGDALPPWHTTEVAEYELLARAGDHLRIAATSEYRLDSQQPGEWRISSLQGSARGAFDVELGHLLPRSRRQVEVAVALRPWGDTITLEHTRELAVRSPGAWPPLPIPVAFLDTAEQGDPLLQRSQPYNPCVGLDGARTGAVSWDYPGGDQRQLTGTCAQGRTSDTWTAWHPDGAKMLEASFADGVPSGQWRQWDERGALLGRSRSRAGRGRLGYWWGNGRKRVQAQLEGGVLHGAFASWFETGAPQARGRFRDGERTGAWQVWDAQGQLVRDILLDPACGIVHSVVEGGPAAIGGLQAGDHIVAVDGVALRDRDSLSAALQAAGEGPIALRIVRGGRERSVRVRPRVQGDEPPRIGIQRACERDAGE